MNAKDYRYFSTVGNYIVIGKKAVDDTADNTAFVYDMTDVATPSAIPALDEYMLGMSPQSNYVLTKDPGTTDYYVKKINIGATAYELTDALNSSTELSFVFSADPTLISNDSVNFLLSGQVGTTYPIKHCRQQTISVWIEKFRQEDCRFWCRCERMYLLECSGNHQRNH